MSTRTPPVKHKNSRRRSNSFSASRQSGGARVPDALHEAIEAERDTLAKAEAVLGCLTIAMEYETDPVNGPYYPHVVQIARDLVRQSINGLDSLTLNRTLLSGKVEDDVDPIDGVYTGDYHTLIVHVPVLVSPAIQ